MALTKKIPDDLDSLLKKSLHEDKSSMIYLFACKTDLAPDGSIQETMIVVTRVHLAIATQGLNGWQIMNLFGNHFYK